MGKKLVKLHLNISEEERSSLERMTKAGGFFSSTDFIRHSLFQHPNAALVFEIQQLAVTMKENGLLTEEKAAEIITRANKALEK